MSNRPSERRGISLGVLLAAVLVGLSIGQVAVSDDLQIKNAALQIIRVTAADICQSVPTVGSGSDLSLSGAAKAKLDAAVTKISDIGIDGAAKYSESQYKGVLQRDLVVALKQENDCRFAVFNALVDRMLPQTSTPASAEQSLSAPGSSQSNQQPPESLLKGKVIAISFVNSQGRRALVLKQLLVAKGAKVNLVPSDGEKTCDMPGPTANSWIPWECKPNIVYFDTVQDTEAAIEMQLAVGEGTTIQLSALRVKDARAQLLLHVNSQ